MRKIVSLIAVLLVFWAKSAWALDMEFYTYGGFDLMVQAFNLIALIFSDIDFKQLMYVFAIYGLIGGGIGWIVATASGQRQVPLLWMVKMIVGAALYLALFVPTGRVAIYDATLNKTQTIGGVPNAIVFVAGCFNKVERAIVKICDTATGPVSSYSGNAGGIGFGLLQNMSNYQDIYATMSMEDYMDKCVLFETMRTGGTIGFGDLTGGSIDFMTTLANAANPAVFTVYYDSSTPGGSPMTCTDAWNKLQPVFTNPASYDSALKKTCNSAFINASDPMELATCKNMISNTVNLSTGTSYSYDTILRQSQLSAMLYHTFMGNAQTSAALQADRSITSSGFGVGATMNEWIPIIRSVLTAIAICLTPFLALLLPTPLVGKVVSVMFGFFVFLTIWGVVDAVIHLGAVVYASNTFQEVGPGNLGMLAMAAMPTLAAKMLAMFGIVRSSGLMLAAFITGMLIKFGGSALAHLAGSLTGVAVQGGQVGGKMYTPEGRTAEQQELLRAWSNMSVESQEKFSNRGRAMALVEERQIANADNTFAVAGRAERSGLVAPGTAESIQGVARMQAGQQNLVTDRGKFSAVVGPDGQMNMLDQSAINPDGSRSDTTTGLGGTGFRTDLTRTSSKLTYSVNGNENNLTSAAITGLDPLKVTNSAMQMKIQGASHAFSRNNGIEKFLSEARNSSGSDASSRTQSDSFNKTFAANFERNLGEGSDFAKSTSWDEQKVLKNFIGAHGGISAEGVGGGIGMDGTLLLTGADGHRFSMKVSESNVNALRSARESAWNETVSQTASTQEGINWLRSFAEKSGDSEAYSLLNEARDISRAQQSTGENLTAPFLQDFARNHFDGSTTPEALRRSADYLSSMITNNGATGARQVDSFFDDFMRRGGYSNATKESVQQGVRDWGSQATGGPNGGGDALSRARAETGHVVPDSFQGRNLGHTDQADGVQRNLDEKASEVTKGMRERNLTNHYNVEQGGSVLGGIQKRPKTDQEKLNLPPEFEAQINRIVQQSEGNSQGGKR